MAKDDYEKHLDTDGGDNGNNGKSAMKVVVGSKEATVDVVWEVAPCAGQNACHIKGW